MGVQTMLDGGLVTSVLFEIPIYGPSGLNAGAKDPDSDRYKPTKERARFSTHNGKVRTYTPSRTKIADQMVKTAWARAGGLNLGDGPIELELAVCLRRPASHMLSSGALSAVGRRFPYPHATKPDLDNATKLVMDALNKCAWRDDVQVVRMEIVKRWIGRREISRFAVSARSVGYVECSSRLLSWEILAS